MRQQLEAAAARAPRRSRRRWTRPCAQQLGHVSRLGAGSRSRSPWARRSRGTDASAVAASRERPASSWRSAASPRVGASAASPGDVGVLGDDAERVEPGGRRDLGEQRLAPRVGRGPGRVEPGHGERTTGPTTRAGLELPEQRRPLPVPAHGVRQPARTSVGRVVHLDAAAVPARRGTPGRRARPSGSSPHEQGAHRPYRAPASAARSCPHRRATGVRPGRRRSRWR